MRIRRDNRIAYALLLIPVGIGIAIRFTHPQLTETQLFLQFWWAWLLIVGACFAIGWLFLKQ